MSGGDIVTIQDDEGFRDVPALRIGNLMYIMARRKDRKQPALYRWSFAEKRAITIATFPNYDEALAFWAFFHALATDYNALAKNVASHVLAHGEWMENSLVEFARRTAEERVP